MSQLVRVLMTSLMTLFCLTCVSGCWDYQRINFRGSVTTIGVDPADGGSEQLLFTLQTPSFSESSGSMEGGKFSGESGGPTAKFKNYSVTASGLDEAMVTAQTQTDRSLFLGNLQVVLLNTKLTKSQVHQVITQLMRNPGVDKVAYIVGTSESAKQILSTPGDVSPGDKIDRTLSSAVKQHGFTVRSHLWEFWRDALDSGVDPYLGLVTIADDKLEVHGMYTFRHMQPAVQLTPEETFGFNLLGRDVAAMVLRVDGAQNPLVLTRLRSWSSVKAAVSGNRVKLLGTVHVVGTLSQDPEMGTTRIDERDIQRYEASAEAKVRELVMGTLKKLQAAQSDPYGFGRYVVVHHPELKPLLQKNWPRLYSQADVNLQVHVIIEGKGSFI